MPRIKKLWVPATELNTKMGAKVRVKQSVETPSRGWGNVSHGEVGTVTELEKVLARDLKVDFPSQSTWSAKYCDLEVYCAEN